jgi:hypothetical protein
VKSIYSFCNWQCRNEFFRTKAFAPHFPDKTYEKIADSLEKKINKIYKSNHTLVGRFKKWLLLNE